MFRGPRMRGANSTRKCDAYAFDVYEREARDVREIRIEREAFLRGVEWVATGKVTQSIPADFPTAENSTSRKFELN